jgi:hypothetical protein
MTLSILCSLLSTTLPYFFFDITATPCIIGSTTNTMAKADTMIEKAQHTVPVIADDENFIRNVEGMIEPSEVSDLICISSLKKLFPPSLFKKILFKTSKKFPQIGFVIDPYCLFLFFKIKDTEQAQSMVLQKKRT